VTTAATLSFPRLPLAGVAVLIGVAIAGVVAHKALAPPETSVAIERPLESRALLFRDQANGGISVTDARTGELVADVKPGTNGFLRGAMRGMARERRRAGFDLSIPFEVSRWNNGHVTLYDPALGRQIDLAAFGPTNAGVFAEYLEQKGGSQ
jgi:putative photosynthetic complex assembly protein